MWMLVRFFNWSYFYPVTGLDHCRLGINRIKGSFNRQFNLMSGLDINEILDPELGNVLVFLPIYP